MFFSVRMLKPALVSFPTPTRGSTIQATQSRARALRDPRSVLAPGTLPPPAHPGDSPRARPPSLGSAAPACPRGALSPAGGHRAAPGGGSAAGLGEHAAPEAAPARAAQVLGAAPGCFLPGAPGAGIRGRRGRPELSGGGGGAGRPGSAALLGG